MTSDQLAASQGMDPGALAVFWSVYMIVALAIAVFSIAGLWKMFGKAGRPGWAAIIPIYNTYVLLKVAGMSGWWLLGFFVPFLNIFVALYLWWKVSEAYGHGFGYFLGLWFLTPIFLMMLGFGKSQYQLPRYQPGA
jgi:hypothetical protein